MGQVNTSQCLFIDKASAIGSWHTTSIFDRDKGPPKQLPDSNRGLCHKNWAFVELNKSAKNSIVNVIKTRLLWTYLVMGYLDSAPDPAKWVFKFKASISIS